MARSRNIKPGLYKNEDLVECSIWARYIFPGLWMLADREGRLEDRPKKIKGELLPHDSVEIDPLLNELAKYKFITRYVVGGIGYIQIIKFLDHQTPHVREQPSTIPAPPKPEQSTTKEVTSTSLGCGMPSPRSPDSLFTDSLSSDSLNPSKPIASSDKSLSAEKKKINGKDLSPVIEKIPIVGDQECEIHQSSVQEWERLFPAVDVPQTLKEIRAWNLANPKNRKTSTGVMRHITQWLAKEQNKPPPQQFQRR
jgi:hypothetical protein